MNSFNVVTAGISAKRLRQSNFEPSEGKTSSRYSSVPKFFISVNLVETEHKIKLVLHIIVLLGTNLVIDRALDLAVNGIGHKLILDSERSVTGLTLSLG